jgi:hypothetical protein
VAILVGLLLEGMKYVNLLIWPLLRDKLEREYGVFHNSATILIWSFVAAMIVLAGAQWAALSAWRVKQGMTKDWKKIARASGLTIPAAEVDRIAPALDALETAFRPLGAPSGRKAIRPVFQADAGGWRVTCSKPRPRSAGAKCLPPS